MQTPTPLGTVKRFFGGVGFLVRGLKLWATSPKLMLLGAVPALIVGAAFTVGLVLFAVNLNTVSAWLTPFADEWDDVPQTVIRVTVGVAAVVAVVFAGLFAFTAVTLAVGDPFYERIWRQVEQRSGGAPVAADESFWAGVRRAAGNGIRLFAATALSGLLLLACGFIPLVGQTVVPVVAAAVGGWFLAVELSGFAFDARRLSLRERRRMLGADRARTLGFGVVTYLLFLVPLGAVFVMPAAVAGATLLARDALDPSAG